MTTVKKPHGNLRFPELHSREELESLVRKYRCPEQIARVLRCNPRTVAFAMEKMGIESLRSTAGIKIRDEV